MCDIHYDYIKNKYCNNSRLLFSDTVSLMYEIKIEDFSKEKKCLILAIIQLNQNIMIVETN